MFSSSRHPTAVCDCSHLRRFHPTVRGRSHNPCNLCGCRSFTPEPICVCGHGKKAHARGYCNQSYLDGCRAFRPRS